MDGHAFAKDVVVTDQNSPSPTSVRDVLRFIAYHHIGVENITGPEFSITKDGHMVQQSTAGVEADPSFQEAEGPDINSFSQLDLGTNDRRRMHMNCFSFSGTHFEWLSRRDLCSGRSPGCS